MSVTIGNDNRFARVTPTHVETPASSLKANIRDTGDILEAYLGKDPFFTYNYKNAAKPYLYPVYGPDSQLMVRNFPMKDLKDEEHDHPHQKAFWFTHGAVNGVDYWTEGEQKGRIVHQNFSKIKCSGNAGIIVSHNYWIKPDRKTVQLKDERAIRFFGTEQKRYLDFYVRLTAIAADAVLGDTKEGTFGIRLAETMRVKGGLNKGHIINADGLKDNETWGKRSFWVDYYGPVNDQIMGLAIFDHPQNPRYPTWWHVRDYGLFAANPFGIHDFEPKTATGEKTPVDAGKLVLKQDESLVFQYRVILHKGNHEEGAIAEEYKKYLNSNS
ncbi:MAG: PmoA family protein [Verrucomicrobia bacterium]|nr:PmoA family protein [Verrucomicrobiota bacterium]